MPSGPRNGPIDMKITCDNCKRKNQYHYYTVMINKSPVTLCEECRWGKRITKNSKTDKQMFDELQTPFWKLMGAKPKEKDIALEKYLKHRGMSYGDWRRERDYHAAKEQSALKDFNKHYKKYGGDNAPDPAFQKDR